jgi:hypothetical protein
VGKSAIDAPENGVLGNGDGLCHVTASKELSRLPRRILRELSRYFCGYGIGVCSMPCQLRIQTSPTVVSWPGAFAPSVSWASSLVSLVFVVVLGSVRPL